MLTPTGKVTVKAYPLVGDSLRGGGRLGRAASLTRFAVVGLSIAACSGTIGDRPDLGPGKAGPASTGSGGVGSGSTGGSGTGSGTGGGPGAMCTPSDAAPDFHRLNAKQYQETVNQLLFTQLTLPDLPVDSQLYGFDNNSESTLTGAAMQKYLDAAKTAVTSALANATSRAKLVPCSLATNAAACVKTVLTAWLPRAFRRPVLPAEIDQLVAYTAVCNSSGEAGLSCALQAALLSPHFLFRTELIAGPEATSCGESTTLVSTTGSILGAYALASRLSYFLWNSAPDDTLYSLAAAGTLGQPTVLAQQVDRMLAPASVSEHPVGFVRDFPQQFLPLTALQTVLPSPAIYPAFDEPLRAAMRDESLAFFSEVLLGNHSALDLVKADYTFVNDRLAKHYGIAGVTGTAMRQVPTTGVNRGGIPSQASFLTATSSTENTSLVLRAKWVLKNLLCVDLPPPPDKSIIDAVPVPDPGLGLTNRESLEIRTAGEPCHSCHQIINPIGFGLETFDGIGQARTLDRNKPIDASGQVPGGMKFADTAELLALLRGDERFPACLTTKLLTYALGRGMVASCDPNEIVALTAQFKADGFKLRNHVQRIVESKMFVSPKARVKVTP